MKRSECLETATPPPRQTYKSLNCRKKAQSCFLSTEICRLSSINKSPVFGLCILCFTTNTILSFISNQSDSIKVAVEGTNTETESDEVVLLQA